MSRRSRRYTENRIRRIELVQRLAREYYEAGRQDRCYKEVWRRYVNPVYPMSYRSFLEYMAADTAAMRQHMLPASTYYRSDIAKPQPLFPEFEDEDEL